MCAGVLSHGVPGETNAAALARVYKGMSKDDVLRELGAPNPEGMSRAAHFDACNDVLIYRERKRLPALRWLDERVRPWSGGAILTVQVCLDTDGRVRDEAWQFISN